MASPWQLWLDRALEYLSDASILRSIRPVFPNPSPLSFSGSMGEPHNHANNINSDIQSFDGPGPWDRSAVEVQISRQTFDLWMNEIPSPGDEINHLDLSSEGAPGLNASPSHKLILFSGNDYLGLSSHPSVRKAACKAAMEFGMGPRGSALICGYTSFHRTLESTLAKMKKTEECLLCPTGFAANLAVMTAVTTAVPHIQGASEDVVAIFSDSLNHASIVDGIRLSRRQSKVEFEIYRHGDMDHLNQLLLNCRNVKKMVVTDSLFSMDGDFAPIVELVALRKKYNFLLVVDDAHGTLVCGDTGGGVAEAYNVDGEVDIIVGTLSKAVGCQGGFIACSRKWKQLILSRGRSFVYSTALPVPIVAAANAAVLVARKEKWRQRTVWERVRQFGEAIGYSFTSPIAPIILGSEEKALAASRSLMLAGFHVTAIRPPTVPKYSSRLRITLSAAHSAEDVRALAAAVRPWIYKDSVAPYNRLLTSYPSKEAQELESLVEKTDKIVSFFQESTSDSIKAKL